MFRPVFQIDAPNGETFDLIFRALFAELSTHAQYERIDARQLTKRRQEAASIVWNTPVVGQSAVIRAWHPSSRKRNSLLKLIRSIPSNLYVDVEAWEAVATSLGGGATLALPAAPTTNNGSIPLPPAS